MNDLSLESRQFKIADTIYEVVATKTGKQGVYNAIDTVVNTNTKERETMRRADLIIMMKKYNAKFVQVENIL